MLSDGLNSLWAARMLSVLRIMAGLLFLQHGTQKLFGFPPPPNGGRRRCRSRLQGVIELVGGGAWS